MRCLIQSKADLIQVQRYIEIMLCDNVLIADSSLHFFPSVCSLNIDFWQVTIPEFMYKFLSLYIVLVGNCIY